MALLRPRKAATKRKTTRRKSTGRRRTAATGTARKLRSAARSRRRDRYGRFI